MGRDLLLGALVGIRGVGADEVVVRRDQSQKLGFEIFTKLESRFVQASL